MRFTMWDWKQLKWMKLFGWDVFETEKGKLGLFLKLEGMFLFSIMPATLIGQIVFITVSLKSGDLTDSITSIAELATAFQATMKSFKWAFRSSEIKGIIEDIEDLDARRKRYFKKGDFTDKLMKNHTNACSKYLSLAGASILAGSHWVFRPFVLAFYKNYKPVAHVWVPWNDKVFVGWFAHFLYVGTVLGSSVSGLLAYESLVLSFNEMTIALVESISYGLASLDFKKATVRQDLRELHLMHKAALNITKKVGRFSNFIVQADGLLFAFTMCCSVLEITREWSSAHRKVNLVELLLVCGGFFFLQCRQCQMVEFVFSNVTTAAYNGDWFNGTVKDKRSLSTIVQMSAKSVEFGNIIRINLSTFIAVMKTSFSYYNALKAFDIK